MLKSLCCDSVQVEKKKLLYDHLSGTKILGLNKED